MAIVTQHFIVGDDPIELTGVDKGVRYGRRIAVQPIGGDVFLGGNAEVTTLNGWKVSDGQVFNDALSENEKLFAVAAEDVDVQVYSGDV